MQGMDRKTVGLRRLHVAEAGVQGNLDQPRTSHALSSISSIIHSFHAIKQRKTPIAHMQRRYALTRIARIFEVAGRKWRGRVRAFKDNQRCTI
jgi:hypothetical protein